MTSYNKPYLTLEEQLELLKQRGLHVDNDAEALVCLGRDGYYRLSAYWYPFRKLVNDERTDQFLEHSSFEDGIRIYYFDKKFKFILLDMIERIEIAVRVKIASHLGRQNPFFLYDEKSFHTDFITKLHKSGKTKYAVWMEKYQELVHRSHDEFIFRYEQLYGSRQRLPIWIAIELWDFGLLSNIYSGLKVKNRETIAKYFAIPDWQMMQSWLICLNYVRNVIAHHGRLWNLNLSQNPKLPTKALMPNFDHLRNLTNSHTRIYSICCILVHFSRIIDQHSVWHNDLINLIDAFPTNPYCKIQDMGFPTYWKNLSLWK